MKKCITDYDLYNKKVIIRLDLNVPIKDGVITDDNRIKKMYPIGAIDSTYIVAQNEDGMFLIDQHAAAERINYEIFKEKLAKHDNTAVDLLVPMKIELVNKDYIILKEHFDILNDLGFVIEEFGTNTVVVRSHPYWLPPNYATESIQKIIDIIVSSEDFNSEKFMDRIAAGVACKASIKAHDPISLTDMEDLIDRLRKCKNPFNCAHGRPTIISYSHYELAKMFKRIMD